MRGLGRAAFEAAVDAYDLDAVAVDPGPAREALEASDGLLLLGEAHGVEQTAAVLWALLRALGLRALALEWAEDELRPVADGDLDALWRLPADAEALSGDGRLTAGHVALLRRAELDRVVLLDRVGSEGEARSRAMQERLLAAPRPILAVLGAAHAERMALEVRGLRPVLLAWAGLSGAPRLAAELPLPPARPAVVPTAA